MSKWITWFRNFKPPLFLSCLLAVVFSVASMVIVSTNAFDGIPASVTYVIYICAVLSLSLAVWAIVLFLKKASLKQQFFDAASKNRFTARLIRDFSYRTTMISCGSLAFNILLAASKMFAGWYYASTWLMVLSGYYIILCLSKSLLLRYGRKQAKLNDKNTVIIHEWKAYRLCGIMFLVMTVFLQGVVIMIVKDGMGFSYNEIIVIAMAAYDFYCLISAVVYMIRKRKNHSPIVNSLKSIGFASSLVAMLSLQTAMLIIRRKMDGKPAIVFHGKLIGITLLSVTGAIILGVGMCMVMIWEMMLPGIIIGIIALLCLIPVCKG